jgi:hypothetical protein
LIDSVSLDRHHGSRTIGAVFRQRQEPAERKNEEDKPKEIEVDVAPSEKDIVRMLREVVG